MQPVSNQYIHSPKDNNAVNSLLGCIRPTHPDYYNTDQASVAEGLALKGRVKQTGKTDKER